MVLHRNRWICSWILCRLKNLAILGYSPGGGVGDPGACFLTEAEIQAVPDDIPDGATKNACDFALRRVGYLYSQELRHSGTHFDWGSIRRMIAYIERINCDTVLLPYTLDEESKLKKKVYFQAAWVEMIQDQTVSILGWIQYEKVKWLQNNNPEVPGLIYKLAPMDEKMRKLNNVRKLWEGILDVSEIRDVFTDEPVISKQYDMGHKEVTFCIRCEKRYTPIFDS